MSKPTICLTGTIEDWMMVAGRIVGMIDGRAITTSLIHSSQDLMLIKSGVVTRTQNSHYYLGKPYESPSN